MQTREEHMAWSKERAIEILDSGDISGAWSSMVSDLQQHDETRDHVAIQLGMMLIMSNNLSTNSEMRKFIEGFN